jgi:aspartate carbamoyltransferase regulatory subunit
MAAKFCSICECFLWLELNDENELVYHCKNCDNIIKHTDTTSSLCVMDNNYMEDNTNYRQYVTKYLKHDPTLPRVNNIKCPNTQCNKPSNEEDEVIFVKYDFQNMKYLYHCTFCEKFWKSDEVGLDKNE